MLPRTETHLRYLASQFLQIYTGARQATLSKIQLKDLHFIWMESEENGWVPGVLIDYVHLKFDPNLWRVKYVLYPSSIPNIDSDR